jgi:hypothetical protein
MQWNTEATVLDITTSGSITTFSLSIGRNSTGKSFANRELNVNSAGAVSAINRRQ